MEVRTEGRKKVVGVQEEGHTVQRVAGEDHKVGGESGQTGVGAHEGHSCGDDNGAFHNVAARETCDSRYGHCHASLPGAALEVWVAGFVEEA